MSNVLTRQIADMFVEESKDGNVYVTGEYTEIEARAFYECNQLKLIDLQETKIKRINELAFRNCENLESVLFPHTLEYIGVDAFRNCCLIKDVALPKELNKLSFSSFENCRSLKRIDFSDNLQEIQSDAFKDCVSIKELHIKGKIKQIGVSVFSGCANLKKIVLPKTLEIICGDLYNSCSQLEEVYITHPNCIIENCGLEKYSNLTIVCNEYSYAHQYAIKNNIPVRLI